MPRGARGRHRSSGREAKGLRNKVDLDIRFGVFNYFSNAFTYITFISLQLNTYELRLPSRTNLSTFSRLSLGIHV